MKWSNKFKICDKCHKRYTRGSFKKHRCVSDDNIARYTNANVPLSDFKSKKV